MKIIEKACFHSLWKQACFVLFFISNIVSAQLFVKDSSVVFINVGATIITDIQSTNSETQKVKVYLTKEATITDFSKTRNYEIVYINGNDKELKNHQSFEDKNTDRNIQIVKAKKTPQIDIKTSNLFLKQTSVQRFFAGQISRLNIGVLVNNNQSKNKAGQLSDVLYDMLLLPSKKIKIFVDFNQNRIITHSESFFTRPPPFFIIS